MASGSEDKTIKIWNIEIFCVLAILKGHSQSVTSLSFNSKGTILASGSEDNNIKIWNLETKRKVSSIEKENFYAINSLAFNNEGTVLAIS